MKMQWESARKVDASNYVNYNKVFQLNSIKSVNVKKFLSVCDKSRKNSRLNENGI